MPLLLTRHLATTATLGIWQIAEDEAFFRTDLPLTSDEENDLAHYKDLRRMEWLASRWLLHKLTGAPERLPLAKNVFAKPFFLDIPDLHCSLSHSHGIVGALLDTQPCGCDIQVLVEKMARLAHKFIGPDEKTFLENHSMDEQFELMHVFWTAKESLYKVYGLKELDFREHLRLEPFDWFEGRGQTRGWVEKGEYRENYKVISEKMALPEEEGEMVWTVALTSGQQASGSM